MPAFEVIAESGFRKESFSSKLVEMGIKIMGQGDKAQLKAFLRFDDDLPPLTYFITDLKTGKSIFETKPDGLVKTRNYGIGQVIEFLREKKGIKTMINLDAGEESWTTVPNTLGAKWKFEAHTPKVRDDAGNIQDGFTNFTLVDIDLGSQPLSVPGSTVPAPANLVVDTPFNLTEWKKFLEVHLTVPLDEKGINKAVQVMAKSQGKTPEQLGLSDRKKVLKLLVTEKFIDTNDDGDYILVK